jgi:hypothetical protein
MKATRPVTNDSPSGASLTCRRSNSLHGKLDAERDALAATAQLHRSLFLFCRAGEIEPFQFGCSTGMVAKSDGKTSDAALPFLSAASGLMLVWCVTSSRQKRRCHPECSKPRFCGLRNRRTPTASSDLCHAFLTHHTSHSAAKAIWRGTLQMTNATIGVGILGPPIRLQTLVGVPAANHALA